MKSVLAIAILLLSGAFFTKVEAQCSDAGVCSLGHDAAMENHSLTLSYSYGQSVKADDLKFHSVSIDWSFSILESSRIIASAPWSVQSGPRGSARGIGDLIVAWDQSLHRSEEGTLGFQVGVKLATGSVNSDNLPQRYQSGLGSNDLLLGLSYTTPTWNGAIGYQVAGGRNMNDVDMLKRGDDVMLRLSYQTSWETTTPSLQILAIKRLGKSSVRNPAASSTNAYIDLPNSDQFQMNILGSILVPIQKSLSLRITAAVPLLSREVNVDGLTRSLTLGTGIVWAF